jgi:hypothetical protein
MKIKMTSLRVILFSVFFILIYGCFTDMVVVEPPSLSLEEDYYTPGGSPSDWGSGEPILVDGSVPYSVSTSPKTAPEGEIADAKKNIRISEKRYDEIKEFGRGGLKLENKFCFAPDTVVLMADGSTKAIKDIVNGDSVMSYDKDNDKASKSEIVETETAEAESYYVINGGIEVTGEHFFYVRDEGPFATTISGFSDEKVLFIKEVERFNDAITLVGDTDGDLDTLEDIPLETHKLVKESGTFNSIKAEPYNNYFVKDEDGRLYLVKCCLEEVGD